MINRPRIVLAAAVVIAGLLYAVGSAFSQDSGKETVCGSWESCSLQGNKPKVQFVVETSAELRSTGLSDQQLETEVELLLRKFDVPIKKSSTADLFLYLNVVGEESTSSDGERTGIYYYCIKCDVRQNVRLDRNPLITVINAVTWEARDTLGLTRKPKATITNVVKDKTKQFINAYLEANPK